MKTLHRVSGDSNERAVQGWLAALILLGGLGIILYATLKDFDFQVKRISLLDYLNGFRLTPSSFYDFPRNVLLFMPFGFGLTAIFDRRRWPVRRISLLILLASFSLTLLVESLQFFLPGRTPNLSDLLANSLGGLAGLGFYYLWREQGRASQWLRAAAKVPGKVLIAAAVYMVFLLFLGAYLMNQTHFVDWDDAYVLLIGNERTGDRPWRGSVSELMIFDRTFSPTEVSNLLLPGDQTTNLEPSLLAYYPLINDGLVADKMGNLPDFEWRGDESGEVDEHQWLQTIQPADYLSEKLQASGQFAIYLTVQTADSQQNGPARILSYSFDTGLRNFTLGQEGSDLVLRVRSPMSGENGAAPEFIFPGILEVLEPQKIVVQYDGLTATVISVDDLELQKIDVVPGASLLRTLKGSDDSPFAVGPSGAGLLMIAFTIIFFVPLGVLTALLLAQIKTIKQRLLILIGGMIIPPLLLEILFSVRNGFEPRFLNFVLGSAVIGLTVMVLFIAFRQFGGVRRSV